MISTTQLFAKLAALLPSALPPEVMDRLDGFTEVDGICRVPIPARALRNVFKHLTETIGLPLSRQVIWNRTAVRGNEWYNSEQFTVSYDFLFPGTETWEQKLNVATWVAIVDFPHVLVSWDAKTRRLGRWHGLPTPDWASV